MRFASIAFVKHLVKHTVYKCGRQGCTPDPHRNQKSGSPYPITPPELEILPHAGPRCAFLGLRRVGGYRGNEIFFMRRVLCASGSPYNANESFFLSAFFGVSGAAKGLSRLGVSLFPPVRGEGPSPGFHRPLRACVRELSRTSRNTTSKAKPPKPAFSDGGSRYRLGKGKRLPTFFTPKSEVFCGVAEPLAGFSLGGPVNFWPPPACSDYRNIRSIHKTKKSRAWMGAALWVAVLS